MPCSVYATVLLAAVLAGGSSLDTQPAPSSDSDGWVPLFNGKNFDGWYTFLPSTGKNADPNGVFKVENGMIHILDIPVTAGKQEFGYLATVREFGRCRIRAEFKWGAKRFPPRQEDKRDSGLLYYFTGPDKIWPRALELQIQETDVGDLWILDGMKVTTKVETDGYPMYVLSGPLKTQTHGRIIKFGDFEDRNGWNTVEAILDGDRITHLVNGRAVMRAWDIQQTSLDNPSLSVPATGGRIMLQAEGAEIWFRNVQMKPLDQPGAVAAAALPSAPQQVDQQPPVVTPGALPGQPPSDAIVLFDGTGAAEWVYRDGRAAQWPVVEGALVSRSGTGNIYTRRNFGSAQIHLEFATPYMPDAHGQARANSGVYLQGRYEVQILDSFENPTYSNGSAGALYGQYAPLVNVSRPPKEWQTYDIVFHAPRCGPDRAIATPGTLTLLHNGVLVQDHVTIRGRTTGGDDTGLCEDGPLMLQDHYHPDVKETFMRFRNIWIRPLP